MNHVDQIYSLFRTYRMIYRASKLDQYRVLALTTLERLKIEIRANRVDNVVYLYQNEEVTQILAA